MLGLFRSEEPLGMRLYQAVKNLGIKPDVIESDGGMFEIAAAGRKFRTFLNLWPSDLCLSIHSGLEYDSGKVPSDLLWQLTNRNRTLPRGRWSLMQGDTRSYFQLRSWLEPEKFTSQALERIMRELLPEAAAVNARFYEGG